MLGEGSGSRKNESVAALTRHPLTRSHEVQRGLARESGHSLNSQSDISSGNEILWGFPEQTVECSGAGDGTRTRDIDLGKVALYQLSYSRRSNFLA